MGVLLYSPIGFQVPLAAVSLRIEVQRFSLRGWLPATSAAETPETPQDSTFTDTDLQIHTVILHAVAPPLQAAAV